MGAERGQAVEALATGVDGKVAEAVGRDGDSRIGPIGPMGPQPAPGIWR